MEHKTAFSVITEKLARYLMGGGRNPELTKNEQVRDTNNGR